MLGDMAGFAVFSGAVDVRRHDGQGAVTAVICRESSWCAARRGVGVVSGKSRRVAMCGVRMDVSREQAGEHLVHAAMVGNVESVKSLLGQGVSPNFASSLGSSGMTPLMWACSEGYLDIARMLLENEDPRVDVAVKAQNGLTAILYCFDNMPPARAGTPPPAGFPGVPGKKSEAKQVPMTVRQTGHVGIAKLLLVRGADPTVTSSFGENCLHMAARKGQLALVELLIGRCEVDAVNKGYKHTALHLAAMEGYDEVAAALIAAEADVNAQNVLGWTPLMWAAARGKVDVVRVLLDAGADTSLRGEATGKPGERTTTALKEAERSVKASEIMSLLRRSGAQE
uniref:Uncharacterized protein n=1 Tax=Erythrolobus madagascarensis TaxID=708628 RepID=A0A7S0XJ94_9RHOD|mmetsp:Transcript_3152/g.6829  ORF Transcript_3152/g.6829 Transcript_3152/m.6829 type:complete len:340 (+) Transcript_3152:44-1063(+)